MTPQTYVLRTEDTAITTGDCISHPNTDTHTHTYISFRKFLLEFLRNFPTPLTEVAGSKSNCQIVQFVISDDSNEYSHHYITS